jgi:hypothetical protein
VPSHLRLVVTNDPGAARHSDPFTSQIAAGSIDATALELIVYTYLSNARRALTALEIARGIPMDIRSVSPRLAPLERKGIVERSDKRYCINDAGNPTLQDTWLVCTDWL